MATTKRLIEQETGISFFPQINIGTMESFAPDVVVPPSEIKAWVNGQASREYVLKNLPSNTIQTVNGSLKLLTQGAMSGQNRGAYVTIRPDYDNCSITAYNVDSSGTATAAKLKLPSWIDLGETLNINSESNLTTIATTSKDLRISSTNSSGAVVIKKLVYSADGVTGASIGGALQPIYLNDGIPTAGPSFTLDDAPYRS